MVLPCPSWWGEPFPPILSPGQGHPAGLEACPGEPTVWQSTPAQNQGPEAVLC